MESVRLEVIAPMFQGMGICTACELVMAEADLGERPTERALDEYPQEWQEEYQRLADWVYDLADRYGDEILIKVIDPRTPEGLLKSLRHWVRQYPTWVVNGKKRAVGWDRQALEAALQHPQEEGHVQADPRPNGE
ncbi:MAG: hypothetical protein PVH17_01470 [Anaerolineae bacterium]|jgi:hypothetical protein